MSNGGGESGSQRRELHGKRKFQGNDFVYAVAKMAVAQICESVEINTSQESQIREGVRFNSFQESALETLTDVVVRYVKSIGKTALLYASMAGRTEGNAIDIVQTLEDLGSGLGFAGATDIDHCLADSGVVKEIIHYIGEAEKMPFVYSLPCIPIKKGKIPAPSFSEVGAEPPDEHIPVWLPVFPESKMPIQLEGGNERTRESDSGRAKLDMQSKSNGSVHLSMQQSYHGDKLEFYKSVNRKDVAKLVEAEVNPFLAAPFRFDEKPVALVIRPEELSIEAAANINHCPDMHMVNNHTTVCETFAPASEIAEHRSKFEDNEKNEPTRTRSLVQFKISTRKASMGLAVNQNIEDRGIQKIADWFQEDDEKNELKPKKDETCGRMIQGLTEM